MNIKKAVVFLFALSMLMTTTMFAQNGDKLPKLNYTEFKLKNGLRVIMHEDKSTPIVAVNVWYHVGSKNEVPGRTGFAHLVRAYDVSRLEKLQQRLFHAACRKPARTSTARPIPTARIITKSCRRIFSNSRSLWKPTEWADF